MLNKKNAKPVSARAKKKAGKKQIILPLYFGWQVRIVWSKIKKAAILFFKKTAVFCKKIIKAIISYCKSIGSFFKLILSSFILERIKDLRKHIVWPFRKYWQNIAAATFLIITVSATAVFIWQSDFIKAATYGWNQSDWSLGADINAVATHTSNQSGWQKFYSKDDNINTGTVGEIKLASTASSITETENADFNAGSQSTDLAASGDFYVNGGNVYLKKVNGASCSSDGECVSGYCDTGSCAVNNWISSSACGIDVYDSDVAETKQWKTTNTDCNTPQCGQDGGQDGDNLVDSNSVDFAAYPARNACKAIGGRLPTKTELNCIYTNKADLGNNFVASYYWSSTETTAAGAWRQHFSAGTPNSTYKNLSYYVRCVRGW